MSPQALVLLVAAAGVPGLVAGGALTTVGTVLAGAIGLGINFGLAAILRKDPPKPKAQKGVVRQDVPIRSKFYGRGRGGSKWLFLETIKGDLYQIAYFGQGPIDGVEEHYVDDRYVELNEDGTAAGGPLNNPYVDLDGDNHLTLKVKLGTEDQTAFDDLIALAPTIWTEDHRGRGMVLAFARQGMTSDKSFGKVWVNRYAQINLVIRGCPVFDPRVGERRWSDPDDATKNPGRNLPLILREYLTDTDGAQIDASYIEDDPNEYGNFCFAADYADEIIATKGGGSTQRYYGQFAYDFDMEPGDNVKRLLQAFAGRLFLKPNGKIGVWPGKWVEPEIHVTEDHLTFYELQDRSGPLRDANEVVVKYTKPNSRYGEGVSDPWRDEDDISNTGLIKNVPVEAYEIQNHNHARRIAKITAHRGNPRWQGSIRTTLFGMQCWDQWIIRLTIAELDIEDETFEITRIELDDENMEVLMDISSLGPDAFEFDPEAEEGTEPIDPQDLDVEDTPEPVNFEAHCEQRKLSTGQSVAVLVSSWEEDPNFEGKARRLEPDAEYSIADADQWFPMAVAYDHLSAESGPVADRDATGNELRYDARMRWNLPSGTPGNWVVVENILAVADAIAPLPAETISAVDIDDNASVTFFVPDAADTVQKARIYRGGASDDFETAAAVSPLLAVSAGVTRTWVDMSVSAGATYRYWVVLLNGSGVASTPAGPAEVSIPA